MKLWSVFGLQEFFMKSKLNFVEFGSFELEIFVVYIEGKLEGFIIEQVLFEKKLFIVDYYDMFFLWVVRINVLENSKIYVF